MYVEGTLGHCRLLALEVLFFITDRQPSAVSRNVKMFKTYHTVLIFDIDMLMLDSWIYINIGQRI